MSDEKEVVAMAALVKKLVEVGEAISSIDKTGFNSGLGFKFVEASQAYNAIRRELYKRGVFMVTSVKSHSREGTLTTVDLNVTFIDSDTGHSLTLPWVGTGSDKQDKGMAKAITAGLKSMLLAEWLIPSGIEPDADAATDVVADAPQEDTVSSERLLSLASAARDAGVPDSRMRAKVNSLGAKRAAQLTDVQVTKLEKWIATEAKKKAAADGQ